MRMDHELRDDPPATGFQPEVEPVHEAPQQLPEVDEESRGW
jgi:hypothetical protein